MVGQCIAGLYYPLLAKEQGRFYSYQKPYRRMQIPASQGGIAAPIGLNIPAELHIKDSSGLPVQMFATKKRPDSGHRSFRTELPDLVKFGVSLRYLRRVNCFDHWKRRTAFPVSCMPAATPPETYRITLSKRVRASRIRVLESYLATEILFKKGNVRRQ